MDDSKHSWLAAVATAAKFKFAAWIAVIALAAAVMSSIVKADESSTELIKVNERVQNREVFSQAWLTSARASNEPVGGNSPRDTSPLKAVGNIASLLTLIARVSRDINPATDEKGFQAWLKARIDLEQSARDRIDGNPTFDPKSAAQLVRRMKVVSKELADHAERIKQAVSASRGKSVKEWTASEYFSTLTEVNGPWLVPFVSLVTVPNYWSWWFRFKCCIDQLYNVNFDDESALARGLPECGYLEYNGIQVMGETAGKRLKENKLLMQEISHAYSKLPPSDQSLSLEGFEREQVFDIEKAVSISRIVLGLDTIAWKGVPAPARYFLTTIPLVIFALEVLFSLENRRLEKTRGSDDWDEISLPTRVFFPLSVLGKGLSAVVTLALLALLFTALWNATWLGQTTAVELAVRFTHVENKGWFQYYGLLWPLAFMPAIFEQITMMRVAS